MFAVGSSEFFAGVPVVATSTTGHAREEGLQRGTRRVRPQRRRCPDAARVAEGTIAGVIFFRDPMGKHPHEPDINMLLRLCDVHNVPLATNPATAELIVRHLG